jgi:hypothetical protein
MECLDSMEAPAASEEELLDWNRVETMKQNNIFGELLAAYEEENSEEEK